MTPPTSVVTLAPPPEAMLDRANVPAPLVTTPSEPVDAPAQPRVRPSGVTAEGAATVAASMLSALALTWVEYERLLPASGALGFWVCWYVAFLALYTGMVALRTRNRLSVVDQLAATLATSAGVLAFAGLALVMGYTISRGYGALHLNFFTQTMNTTGPLEPLTSGGALHAMVGTIEQVGIGTVLAVPLGIATALYLNEIQGRLAKVVRTVVDAMSALPSIVAGLFIFASVILSFGVEKSGIAASLALTVMMMPIVTRTAEVVFRLVPGGLREASYALGAPQWRTVLFVVLPTAKSSLVTAVILGVARGVGETAPVLLTAGFTSAMNLNPLKGPQVSLPLYIFTYVKYPQADMIARAYGAALVLLILVSVLFVAARMIGGFGPGQVSRRQRRRLRAAGATR